MKIAALCLLVGSASAFTSPASKVVTSASLLMSEDTTSVPETSVETPSAESLPAMSQSLPFMARPAALDGSLAGDVGFDPLGFAKNKEDLWNYREAEVKHARLAMLAAAGWPLSELWDKKLASLLALPAVVDASDRAPSVLNGGLGKVSPIYWVICLVAAGAIDVVGIMKSRSAARGEGYVPGNFGFDPLGLYPKDEKAQMDMQLKEIKNGRLAMIAITAFAFQEFVSKIGVVDETPIFFKPLGEAFQQVTNAGYIHP